MITRRRSAGQSGNLQSRLGFCTVWLKLRLTPSRRFLLFLHGNMWYNDLMDIHIPEFVKHCIHMLEENGHRAYIVGGCLRDSLRGTPPADWDICTTALPEEMQAALAGKVRTLPTGLKHGTLTLLGERMSVEATTMRRDGPYTDHRRPDTVSFTLALEEDLARRDFTVNAMAFSPREGLCDPFGGQKDLAGQILRCVGDPLRRFEEDALRILRLFRFAAALGFLPQPETLAGAGAKKNLLGAVSAERISGELSKLIMGQKAEAALGLAAECGVLGEIIPALRPAIGFDQRSPYHNRTVDAHSFAALAFAPPSHDLRLALLLHDIGKPATATFDENGQGHYKGHAGVGAEIAAGVLKELRYPAKTAAYVQKLIAFHSKKIPAQPEVLRRFMGEHGVAFARELLVLKEADNRAKSDICAPRLEHCRRVKKMLEEIVAAGDCLTLADLAVKGKDLAQAGIPPGPQTGAALRRLLELVWQHPEKNDRQILLGEMAIDNGQWTMDN